MTTVGVAIPSIPPRAPLLARALESVTKQTRLPDAVSVAIDNEAKGPALTRNRAMNALRTEWTAFLDDDDYFDPIHLEWLLDYQEHTGADLVYPWFTVDNGDDPFPYHFGQEWDPERIHIFPVAYLVRTELARAAQFPSREELADAWAIRCDDVKGGEDWHFVKRVISLGAKIVHLPERTWHWDHHGKNCSGVTWTEVYQ